MQTLAFAAVAESGVEAAFETFPAGVPGSLPRAQQPLQAVGGFPVTLLEFIKLGQAVQGGQGELRGEMMQLLAAPNLDRGAAVAPGVYFLSARAAERLVSRRVTLTR